ncbi:MAG: hypothetical protein K2X93_25065 [Candidatus Obscuribacterales bacterium]|nr:hypothetical protein [Candidatus Obscuribacterales bacterium]
MVSELAQNGMIAGSRSWLRNNAPRIVVTTIASFGRSLTAPRVSAASSVPDTNLYSNAGDNMPVLFLGTELGKPDDLKRTGNHLISQVTGLWTAGSAPDDRKLADFCTHAKGQLFVLTADVVECAARVDELRMRTFTPHPSANFKALPAAADNLLDSITHTLNAAVASLHAASQLLDAAEQAAPDREQAVLASGCLSRIDRLRGRVRVLLDGIDLITVENIFVDFACNNIVE